MLPTGCVKKVEKGRLRALITYRKVVLLALAARDWTRDADDPGRSSPGPVLPAGGVKKVKTGR